MAEETAAAETSPDVGIINIEVSNVERWPLNPRQTIDDLALGQLAESIRRQGVLQNIVVRRIGNPDNPVDSLRCEVIAGERRWRAALMVGLETIPARVLPRDTTDAVAFELAFRENMDRQGLAPLDEAAGYQQMLSLSHITQEQLGERMGVAQSTIANALRLLQLPAPVQDEVRKGRLSKSVALVLCQLNDHPADCGEIAFSAADAGFSLRQVEQLVGARRKNLKDAETERQSNLALPLETSDSEPVEATTGEGAAAALDAPSVSMVADYDAAADGTEEEADDDVAEQGEGAAESAPESQAAPADAGTPAPDAADQATIDAARAIEEAAKAVTARNKAEANALTRPVAPTSTPVSSTPPAAPVQTPTPVLASDAETVTAPTGPMVATSIPLEREDWLWSENLELTDALHELEMYRLSPRAKHALGLLYDRYEAKVADDSGMPELTRAEHLEMVLLVYAQQAGVIE